MWVSYMMNLVAFLLGHMTQAATIEQDLQPFIAKFPTCAQNCASPILSTLPCNMGTFQQYTDCTCPDMATRGDISACFQVGCNLTDTFISFSVGYETCKGYPFPSRAPELTRTAATMLVVIVICMGLKTWARVITSNKFWWDDWLLWASIACAVVYYGLLIRASFGMLGKHIFTLDPSILLNETKLLYFVKPFYILAQNLIKLSILCFYLRLFPQPWFRYCIFGVQFVIAAHAIIFVLMEIFLCVPIQGSWDPSVGAECLDENLLIYVGSSVSIVSDLVILGLPIPLIVKLQLGLGKRIGLVVMLGLGSFACITTMLRLRYIAAYDNPYDLSWDNFDIGLWSAIEVGTATICACLAALRPLLATFLPKLFGSSSGQTVARNFDSRNGLSNARSGYVRSAIGRSSVIQPPSKQNNDVHMQDIAMHSDTNQSTSKESQDGLVGPRS